jgi:hypothetical protein
MSSPYHYPEGPRSNIPFNPLTKWFALRYWSFMAVGFGELSAKQPSSKQQLTYDRGPVWRRSLADIQEQIDGSSFMLMEEVLMVVEY